ncbi:unnamed protein product [Pedinophyceae sp. YPF-701]|nr:unnamed protein product [Pedinophyceae sp. YPF-701]
MAGTGVAAAVERGSRPIDMSEELPWCSQFWLQRNPLTRSTVLDYMYGSPFYDKRAKDRQILPAQLRSAGLGFDYRVKSSTGAGDFFLIARVAVDPETGEDGEEQALYSVLHGFVSQVPSLARILTSRLRLAQDYLADGLNLAEEAMRAMETRTHDKKSRAEVRAAVGDGASRRLAERALHHLSRQWAEAVPRKVEEAAQRARGPAQPSQAEAKPVIVGEGSRRRPREEQDGDTPDAKRQRS